jgi:hypothetical protein
VSWIPRGPERRAAAARITLALLALAAPASALAAEAPDAAGQLELWWARSFDSTEELVVSHDVGLTLNPEGSQSRVQTVVARVALEWLGARVLYLEEFPHDDPGNLRRQALLVLHGDREWPARVEVEQYTLRHPARFAHLDRSGELLRTLRREDVESLAGCTLYLELWGLQFRGGTRGKRCIDERAGVRRYVDYQMVVGQDLYWYRRRLLRTRDDEILEEIAGFDRFAPLEARLFTCRVHHERELFAVDLHDQGGKARFTLADGREYELELHARDWPFSEGRDALVLLLRRVGESAARAAGWTGIDPDAIGLEAEGLRIDCAAVVPERREERS